ncbi:MAG: hypothetical protein HFI38_13185 [Lachnospiraceae bacterium]|nr:hypothetical protein [Lachnospiraceae bacterium]
MEENGAMDLREYGLTTVCNIYQIDPIGNYNIEWVDAKELVVPERLDLISKIIYTDYCYNQREGEFAIEFYKRDLEVCTMGTFNEYGNETKNKFKDYCNVFKVLIDDIVTNGFREEGVIPVDCNGIIMDGAHRTAIAAFLGIKVPIIRFDVSSPAMGAELYRKRLASNADIEFALTEMCKWNDNLYLCCMWPAADSTKRKMAVDILKDEADLLYNKVIEMSMNGLSNLIPQIYLSHEWVGSIDNRFISAAPKIEGVSGNGNLEVFLFRSDSLVHVKQIKDQMRSIFGIDEHSLHITDYPDETLFIAQMLLNKNTVDFLNKANPFYYVHLNRRIYQYRESIKEVGGNINDYLIDSSSIMGLYGMRKPDDLDYLFVGKSEVDFNDKSITNHIGEVEYYGNSVSDLVFNPVNYIYYAGLKIISLQTLVQFKKNRNTVKDREDIALINDYLENKHMIRRIVITMVQTLRRKSRNAMYSFLRKLPGGGYEKVRSLYHLLKRK